MNKSHLRSFIVFIIVVMPSMINAQNPTIDANTIDVIPYHYEILQDEVEPYWIRIIQHPDNKNVEELVLDEEYQIITDSINDVRKRAIVTSIGDNAFWFTNLKKIVLSSTVNEIGVNSFGGTYYLEGVKLNDGLLFIGSKAFRNSQLQKISIPETVIYLDSQIFMRASKIEEIILPKTIKSLHGYTFVNCKKLKDIYCYAVEPPVADTTDFYARWNGPIPFPESEILDNINLKECVLHVPAGSEDTYRKAPGWELFENIVPITDN